MVKNNLDTISSLLKLHGLNGIINDPELNQRTFTISGCPYIEYSPWMIAYHTEYLNSHTNVAENFTISVLNGHQPCALINITLVKLDSGEFSLLSNASGILPPYLFDSLSRKQKRKIAQKCFDFYLGIAKSFNIKELQFQTTFVSGESEGWFSILQNVGKPQFSQELYCDLSLSTEQYRQAIRDKYKKHIKSGLKLWDVQIVEQVTVEKFSEIQNLHLEVVGFVTRSDITWQQLRNAINLKQAFAVTAYDGDKLVGAAIFSYTSKVAVYSMGVYDRTLFDDPVSHVVHFTAIEHMKYLGLKEYHLGSRCHQSEWMMPSDKETQIGYFKEGFMTHSRFKVSFNITQPEIDQ